MLTVRRDENDVRLLEAQNLFAQIQKIGEESIERSRSDAAAVINRVDRRGGILWRKCMVEPAGSEVFANGLQRTEKVFRHPIRSRHLEIGSASRSNGP